MKNYSNLTYTYAGRKYTFSAYLYINAFNNTTDGNYLVNDNVVMFLYANSLNLLYLDGEFIYIDKYGVVDRFLEKLFVYLQILNIQHEIDIDGDITLEKLSEINKFLHNFFVNNIEILERKGTEITYKLSLVSQNWMNCVSNIQYSNYNRLPEEIFDIIRSIIGQVDLTVHELTFDAIKSDVKISYIANENDNVITTVLHLLRKLYYYNSKLLSMKFIVYNETMHRYLLFDLANQNYINGVTFLIISMFKSQTENLFYACPALVATVTKFPKQLTFLNMFTREVYDYDYQYNNFIDCTVSSDAINTFKNEKPLTTEDVYEKKFNLYNSTLTYKESSTYWNNDINVYGEVAKILSQDNSLVATTDAEILRKPGSYVEISLDRDDIKVAGEEDIRKLQDIKNKYKALEGLWFVGKVRHMISPSQAKYQLNLVLFRNFVKKYK